LRSLALGLGVVAALVLALPPAAGAQPAEVRAQAQQKAAQGAALADQGKHAEAVQLFRDAYQLYPNPGYLYNLGIAYQALGDDVQALRELETFLDKAQKVAPEFIADAVAQAREIRKRILIVEVRCSEAGALVAIDGKEAGRTPLGRSLRARPGLHRLVVSKPGFASYEKEVVGQQGEELTVEATLRPARLAGPDGTSSEGTGARRQAVELSEPARPAAPALRSGADIGASLGLQGWVAGLEKADASLAFRIDAGFTPASARDSRLTFRAGASLGVSSVTATNQTTTAAAPGNSRATFASLLLVPGARLSLTPALYLAGDLGLGVLLVSGVHDGSGFLPDGARVSGSLLSAPELRPTVGIGLELTAGLAFFVGGGLAVNAPWPWQDRFLGDGRLVRAELGAGLRWKP
jgi:hypothetical protein